MILILQHFYQIILKLIQRRKLMINSIIYLHEKIIMVSLIIKKLRRIIRKVIIVKQAQNFVANTFNPTV